MSFRVDSVVEDFERRQQSSDPLIGDEDPVVIFHSQLYEEQLLENFRLEMERRYQRHLKQEANGSPCKTSSSNFVTSPAYLPSPSPVPSPIFGPDDSLNSVKLEVTSDLESLPISSIFNPYSSSESMCDHDYSTKSLISNIQLNDDSISSNGGGSIRAAPRRGRPSKPIDAKGSKSSMYARRYREDKKAESEMNLKRIKDLEAQLEQERSEKAKIFERFKGAEAELQQLRDVLYSRGSKIGQQFERISAFVSSNPSHMVGSSLEQNSPSSGLCFHMSGDSMNLEFCMSCNKRVAARKAEQTSLDSISMDDHFPELASNLDNYRY